MVRSGGGIQWLIIKYIYNIKIYVYLKMLTLNFKVIYKTVCYEDQLVFFTLEHFCTEALCIWNHVFINLFLEK